jgi:hypothetical protein
MRSALRSTIGLAASAMFMCMALAIHAQNDTQKASNAAVAPLPPPPGVGWCARSMAGLSLKSPSKRKLGREQPQERWLGLDGKRRSNSKSRNRNA